MVYRFHDLNDAVPTPEERRLVRRGVLLHVSIDARIYSAGQPPSVTWSDIADGRFDDTLKAQARGVASLKRPVFLTFEHEADQQAKVFKGTGADFVAAWRHVHQLFQDAGAGNAIWVWVMMGTQPSLPRAAQMWPGNRYVDWISWDVYNASGCRIGQTTPGREESFETQMRVFYDWLERSGPALGIDLSKPMMISEAGSVVYPGNLGRTAAWYQEVPGVLRRHPKIKAITLWDHTGNGSCDYRFTRDQELSEAVSTMIEKQRTASGSPSNRLRSLDQEAKGR